jgi:hypothetical protein
MHVAFVARLPERHFLNFPGHTLLTAKIANGGLFLRRHCSLASARTKANREAICADVNSLTLWGEGECVRTLSGTPSPLRFGVAIRPDAGAVAGCEKPKPRTGQRLMVASRRPTKARRGRPTPRSGPGFLPHRCASPWGRKRQRAVPGSSQESQSCPALRRGLDDRNAQELEHFSHFPRGPRNPGDSRPLLASRDCDFGRPTEDGESISEPLTSAAGQAKEMSNGPTPRH